MITDSIRAAFATEAQGTWSVIINVALVVTFALALAVTIDRLLAIRFRARTDTDSFLAQVQKLVLSGEVSRAVAMCAAAPTIAVAQVARAGLSQASSGPDAVRTALAQAVTDVLPPLGRRLSWLNGIARVAALLTFAGTSLAAWHMLEAMKQPVDGGRGDALSAAIAGASAAGLLGVVTVVLSLGAKVALTQLLVQISRDVETTGAKVMALLASHSPQAPS